MNNNAEYMNTILFIIITAEHDKRNPKNKEIIIIGYVIGFLSIAIKIYVNVDWRIKDWNIKIHKIANNIPIKKNNRISYIHWFLIF